MNRADLPPGPPYPAALQAVGFWTRPFAFLRQCRERYGKRFTIRLPMSSPFAMLTDPADVKEVFTASPDVLLPGRGARVLEPILGSNSVILLDGAAHMEQRKLMLPAFHGERMERLTELMEEVAAEELERLPRGAPVALHPRMQELTLKIVLRAVFGLDPGPRFEALRQRLREMLVFGDRPISLTPPPKDSLAERVLRRIGPFARFSRTQEEVDELLFELIAERRAEGAERDDVLAMLLEARHEDAGSAERASEIAGDDERERAKRESGRPMSEQEIRDELLTLLVAGHETTATTLAWAFERLSHEPRVLARLVAEVEGDEDAYLTATIQETLRDRPVLPNAAPRLVAEPVEIGGWRYPVGCSLVLNGYLLHHDPEIYPDPDSFRPERFLEEPPGTYTWIPFGGGRRRCLGASFAMLEMKVVLRGALRALDLRPGGGAEVARRRNITVRPSHGAAAILADRRPAPVAA